MLSGYEQKGKRFIPPIFRLTGIVETNFREEKIPELFWVSSIFLQASDDLAIETVIQFVKTCEVRLGKDSTKPLVFISNFLALSPEQIADLMADPGCRELFPNLGRFLGHHTRLLEDYPLEPLVPLVSNDKNDGSAVEQLKSDVGEMLDRRSHHATKVQATALISLIATGRMHISRHIPVPDLKAIFVSPGSEEAEKAAGFVRLSFDAGSGFYVDGDVSASWRKSFWSQTYGLSPCE